MSRPLLLDLFCGAGGAAMGYYRAGFEVVGIDINPQPHYPFAFRQGNALNPSDWLEATNGREPDVIHASPPCQAFSSIGKMSRTKRGKRERFDLIEPMRALLVASGVPYVIENVVGAPLLAPVRVCGSSFDLRVQRHRLFESNIPLIGSTCRHDPGRPPLAVYGDHPENSRIRNDGGGGRIWRAPNSIAGQEAMGVDWLPRVGRLNDTWRPLTQMIPPSYSEFIGRQIMDVL